MSTAHPATLEEAIRESGEGWLIDWFAPREKAIEHLSQTLDVVDRRAKERLGENAPSLDEASILKALQTHPQSVRGFFQALGGTRTPDMLLMVWRIIQGMEIKDIQLSYHRQQRFELRVVLESPYGNNDEIYESANIQDFALLRHIGILEISGKPVFDGFYPMKLRGM
jgi:hypothetical protein